MQNIQETIERDEVRRLNADALSAVMGECGLAIPIAEYRHWRPTVRSVGEVHGLWRAEVIATDGVVGVFKDLATGQYVKGHVGWFSGEVKTLHGAEEKETTKHNGPPADVTPEQLEELDRWLAERGMVRKSAGAGNGNSPARKGKTKGAKGPRKPKFSAEDELNNLGL